ncbi:cache domain-containing sensor histidine kinase [Paenibacillus chibensis]|uniref:cache domain-containing sensor histidine kinase n=1 Tax=Paenibacillus chibensis TaxID=59846 RepID=UPI000FD9BB6A|nr:sensor histidine kinase [Paenibacillus chibensis]MEC0369579.1 sensor histidine kinase [Paenibacillus chibensis]
MKANRRLNPRMRLSDMGMEKRLLLVFIIIIILPLSIISLISYNSYSRSIQENTVLYSRNMIGQMMERVDDYIDDMKRISSIPAYIDDIKLNLVRSNEYHEQRRQAVGDEGSQAFPNDFDLQLSIQRGIEGNIAFINNIKRGANSVYIFDEYGNGYYSSKDGAVRLDIADSYALWKDKVAVTHGEAMLFSTQEYRSNLKSNRYAFTVVRKILDRSLNPIGLIAVDANISVIEDQVVELDKVTRGTSLIIDEQGNVIYDSGRKILATNASENPVVLKAEGSSGSFYDTVDSKRQLYIYSTSPQTQWKVIIRIPVKELTKEADVTRNVTLVATLFIIGIALLASIILSFAFTKPMKKMIELMRRVQAGDLSVKFKVKHRDEIGQLGNQFNRMLSRIQHLIEDIYQIESQKKEAEMQALQSQINPHFVYNTLETIRMTAELNDDTDAADMISILGKMLRYSIGGHIHDEVAMREEMDHVVHYVQLLNYRYPSRFKLHLDMPDPLKDYAVIRLLFQPIVENAVYHGLDDLKLKMNIWIEAEMTSGMTRIKIRDDGCGMDHRTLEALNQSLQSKTAPRRMEGSGGIGLRNVHERICLHYGRAYGMKVFSSPGAGTEVVIELPPFPGKPARLASSLDVHGRIGR